MFIVFTKHMFLFSRKHCNFCHLWNDNICPCRWRWRISDGTCRFGLSSQFRGEFRIWIFDLCCGSCCNLGNISSFRCRSSFEHVGIWRVYSQRRCSNWYILCIECHNKCQKLVLCCIYIMKKEMSRFRCNN